MSAMATKANFEYLLNNSEPLNGYRADLPIPLAAWRNGADGTVLTGASTPAVILVTQTSGKVEVVQWAANAAATVIASASFVMPGEYGKDAKPDGTRVTDDLVFLATMRRQRNAADAAAWKAQLAVQWWTPGTTLTDVKTFTTQPLAAVPANAADNTTNLNDFSQLTFDIGARLRAEGLRINAGDVVRFILGPATANANSALQFAGGVVRMRRHAALATRSLR